MNIAIDRGNSTLVHAPQCIQTETLQTSCQLGDHEEVYLAEIVDPMVLEQPQYETKKGRKHDDKPSGPITRRSARSAKTDRSSPPPATGPAYEIDKSIKKRNPDVEMALETPPKKRKVDPSEEDRMEEEPPAKVASKIEDLFFDKRYTCDICGYSTTKKSSMTVHLRTHTGEKPYQCKYCDYSTHQQGTLTVHVRTHTGEKPFKCGYCDYSAIQKGDVTKHLAIHADEIPFKCTWEGCKAAFSQLSELKQHKEKTHVREPGDPFRCEHCAYSTHSKYNFSLHLRTHTGEKPFKCPHCDYSACRKANLERHLKRHKENPFTCEHCGYTTTHKSSFTKHLTLHKASVQEGEQKAYKCDHCFYSTEQKYNLALHLRTHTAEKPFKCDWEGCNASFTMSSSLKDHTSLHTGEKPFSCAEDGCIMAFRFKSQLMSHLKEHNPPIEPPVVEKKTPMSSLKKRFTRS